jgi:hypothetical protein
MTDSVAIERERCASIADGLADRWEASAAKIRECGKTRFFWIGRPYVTPDAEKSARTIESAASGVRAVAMLIREGAVPVKNSDQQQENSADKK